MSNAQLCAGGCGLKEDIDHLLLSCDFFVKIWFDNNNWLCFVTVQLTHITYHLHQFGSQGDY